MTVQVHTLPLKYNEDQIPFRNQGRLRPSYPAWELQEYYFSLTLALEEKASKKVTDSL